MTNKTKKATLLAQAASDAESEQQRQNDVVAAKITDPSNQGGVDASDLTVRLLSTSSDPEATNGTERSITSGLPSSSSGRAKAPAYSSRLQRQEKGRSELSLESQSEETTAATFAASTLTDPGYFLDPNQELPAFDRSTSTSPKRKRGITLTYSEFLAQREPPPPPPLETRDDKRRKIAFAARASATAEKTKALLLAKGKTNPTDDDLIAVINKLQDFDKKQKLTLTQASRQQREQERLQKLPPLIFPRRPVDLLQAEGHYGREKLNEFFDRCTTVRSEHALRGRSPADLPEGFFAKEYHHGKWVVNGPGTASWSPFFYPHGYFDGGDGRWIGNLTPDKTRVYRRDGTVGPEYSGFN